MSQYSSRIGLTNNTVVPRIIYIEPWASDFTLLPKQSLELTANDKNAQPWFIVVEHPEATQIFVEGTDIHSFDFTVRSEGKEIEDGYQRQAAIDAGLKI